jgi:hypothetical protein
LYLKVLVEQCERPDEELLHVEIELILILLLYHRIFDRSLVVYAESVWQDGVWIAAVAIAAPRLDFCKAVAFVVAVLEAADAEDGGLVVGAVVASIHCIHLDLPIY